MINITNLNKNNVIREDNFFRSFNTSKINVSPNVDVYDVSVLNYCIQKNNQFICSFLYPTNV